MRTDRWFFVLLTSLTSCGLLAPPGDYGSEWTTESGGAAPDAADASSEDGG